MKKKALIICALALVLVFAASSVLASNRIAEPTATPDGELNRLTKQTADPDGRVLDHKIVGGDASEKQLPEFTEVDIKDSIAFYRPIMWGQYLGYSVVRFDIQSGGTPSGERKLIISCENGSMLSDENTGSSIEISSYVDSFESGWQVVFKMYGKPREHGPNGYFVNSEFVPSESEETVRVLICEGDGVVGYALIHFWNIDRGEAAFCENGSIRKAVMFEQDGERVALTMDQANALLDQAEHDLIDEVDFRELSRTDEDDLYNWAKYAEVWGFTISSNN